MIAIPLVNVGLSIVAGHLADHLVAGLLRTAVARLAAGTAVDHLAEGTAVDHLVEGTAVDHLAAVDPLGTADSHLLVAQQQQQ